MHLSKLSDLVSRQAGTMAMRSFPAGILPACEACGAFTLRVQKTHRMNPLQAIAPAWREPMTA